MAVETEAPTRYAPPWLFGITNLPFGIAGGYVFAAMPYFLGHAGVSGDHIANISAAALIPASLQLFWAPIVDLGIRRREWLILVSILGAICLAMTLTVPIPPVQIPMASAEVPFRYTVFMVIGQAFCGLVASCNGALVSLTLPGHEKTRAAGWVNAANLGGATFGGGIIMTLADPSAINDMAKSLASGWPTLSHALSSLAPYCSLKTGALALVSMIIIPFFALRVPEPPPSRDPLLKHLGAMVKDVVAAVTARKGWTGLLFCFSPVGTMALTNLLSDMGPDFHAQASTVVLLNGYAGGFVQAGSCLLAGYLLDRMECRKAYLLSGVLTALTALAIAVSPLTQATFIAGCVAYFMVCGLAYTAFSAVVYEIVGSAGKTAATLYSVFPAIGNLAISYTTVCDGQGQKRFGVRGAFMGDCVMNVLGLIFLCALLFFLKKSPEASEDVVTA